MAIQSVERALQVLGLFSQHHPDLGIAEISRSTGLAPGTAHGLVRTMAQKGFLRQDPRSRRYSLGLRIYELGIVAAETLELNQRAGGPAHQLSRKTQLVVRVATWDGDSMVVTLTAHPRPRGSFPHQIGPRVHAYCSAIGKAVLAFIGKKDVQDYLSRTSMTPFTGSTISGKKELLADLERTRERGYALDREEAVHGIACIGAPIFERGQQVAGAISLSGSPARILGEKTGELAEELLKTASEINCYMGGFPQVRAVMAASVSQEHRK